MLSSGVTLGAMQSPRLSLLLVLVPLLLACASSSPDNERATELEFHIEQLPASEFDVEQKGAVSVAYRMTVRNRSANQVTLRQLEMQAVGRSPYVLRNETLSFNETIEPGSEATVAFSMWAYPRAEGAGSGRTVSVRGVAHFDGPAGSFQTPFWQSFREPAATD